MSFFNDEFFKELDKEIDVKEEEEENNSSEKGFEESYYQNDVNLDVNKRNQETFSELMDNASYKNDTYWDANNPVVKILLGVLFIIIVAGLLYYVIGWINMSK